MKEDRPDSTDDGRQEEQKQEGKPGKKARTAPSEGRSMEGNREEGQEINPRSWLHILDRTSV